MSEFSNITPLDYGSELKGDTRKRLDKLFFQVNTMLGGTSIDVHLEDQDYVVAFEYAVSRYRQMSSRSVYQSFGFLNLEPLVQVYKVPAMVDNIEYIFRSRGLFGGVGGGVGSFESFGAATANILLRGGMGANGTSMDLASYDFLMQYTKTIDRLFARHIHFTYRNWDNTLVITQTPRVKETVGLKVWVIKSYDELLSDHFSYDWLLRYTLAQSKVQLGEKYSLFSTLPGAQGGSTMKGDALKQAGAEEKTNLENDILVWADNSEIALPIRG